MIFHERMVFFVCTIAFCMQCRVHENPFNEGCKIMTNNVYQAKSGKFFIQDDQKNPIVLQWEKIDSTSAMLNKKIRGARAVFVNAYVEQELDFARKYPERVSQEYFLKSLTPLFEDATNIDWEAVEREIKKVFDNFFETTDFAQFIDVADTTLFVEAKHQQTGEILGAVQFLVSPKFQPNHVRACYFGVASNAQERGIELALMSSIFMIAAKTTRIFLHTRASNEKMLNVYYAWGFKQFAGNLINWPDLEYKTSESTFLQDKAHTLVN